MKRRGLILQFQAPVERRIAGCFAPLLVPKPKKLRRTAFNHDLMVFARLNREVVTEEAGRSLAAMRKGQRATSR
jgi:hypothetical protein